MKKHYFFLLFLSTLINIIISSSLQARNSHRLISLASGQIIHKYKANLDTLVTKKVDTDEIKIQPNKIGRLQSALDTADEIQIIKVRKNKSAFKIILDTTFKENNNKDLEYAQSSDYKDSVQTKEVKRLQNSSRKVLLLGSIATALSIHLYQKRQHEIKENKNIETKEDDYEFGFIILLLLILLIVGRKIIDYWSKWKKTISDKLNLISKITLRISLVYYTIIALSFGLILTAALLFLFFYIFIFIPFALIAYR